MSTDHDPEVAAVLAEALWRIGNERIGHRDWESVSSHYMTEATEALAALTAEGIRCLYVPEGVAVAHGARLVAVGIGAFHRHYIIEATP